MKRPYVLTYWMVGSINFRVYSEPEQFGIKLSLANSWPEIVTYISDISSTGYNNNMIPVTKTSITSLIFTFI